MANSDPKIMENYIASKAPTKEMAEEEVGSVADLDRGKTVFPRDKDGRPMFWDYQIKGFFKDTAAALRKVPNSACSKVRAYKKAIDGNIFIKERRIPLQSQDGSELSIGDCQRPLRAQTPLGERIALADSETVPEGTYIEFTIMMLNPKDERWVVECLEFGKLRGLGQWRNSGKGRFDVEYIAESGQTPVRAKRYAKEVWNSLMSDGDEAEDEEAASDSDAA